MQDQFFSNNKTLFNYYIFFLATVPCENTKYGCCSDGKNIAQGWFKEGCKGKKELIV